MAADQEGNVAAEAETKPRRRRRRWPWVLLLLLVSLVAGLRVALPTIVERGAAYGSRYWLGLPVRIENAEFALLDGTFVLEGVTVASDPDSVTPKDAALEPPPITADRALLHFDRVFAHLSWQDLREHRVHLSDLVLDAPTVRVVRETDGAIDPLRHARPLAPPSPPEPAPPAGQAPSEPWPVALDHFALSAPDVGIVDPRSGQNLLQFSLEKFALDRISASGSQFSLGGVEIEGPVLRVRRDLVLAAQASPVPPPGDAGDAAPATAPKSADTAAPGSAAEGAASAQSAAKAADGASATPAAGTASPAATPTGAASSGAGAAADAANPASANPPANAAALPPADAAPAAAAKPAPAGYRIEKIDIAHATFTWVTDKGPLDVALALKASDITADEGKHFPIDLSLEIAKGRIALAGEVGILPPSYAGKLSWSGLPFPPLLLASLPELAAWLRSADSTGDLQLDADVAGLKGPPSLRMSGRTTVETLAIADPGDKEFALGWKQFEVVMKEVVVPLPEAGKPARTTVANFDLIRLTEPKIRYRHPSPALNALLGIKTAPPADAKAPAPAESKTSAEPKPAEGKPGETTAAATKGGAVPAKAAAKPAKSAGLEAQKGQPPAPATAPVVDVTISTLELLAGDLEMVDTTVKPPATSTIKGLFASASAVHFPDPEAKAVKIRAILPKASAFTIEGDLRPGNNGDFTISLQKLDLPVFNSYALAAGASLDAGQASIKTKVKLRGRVMQIDNDLVLKKFGVSLRDPSTFERSFGMPIDLVLALLRDPAGDIALKIPVKVDEKGAEVSTGAIIASALKAALIGALTSPLKLLGGVFDGAQGVVGGMFGIPAMPCRPGVADLAEAASDRSDNLTKLLADRPTMGLVLRGRTGPQDQPILAEQVLAETVKAGRNLPEVEGSGILVRRRIGKILLERDKSGAGNRGEAPNLPPEDKVLFDRYVAAATVTPDRADALAKARAGKVKEMLVAKAVEADRLTIGEREADGDPGVVVSLATH